MRRFSRWLIAMTAVLVAGLVSTAAAPAWAIDLTGTWEGKIKCTVLPDGESIDTQSVEVALFITQTGDDLNLALAPFALANGRVVEDAANPDKGMASLVACGSNDTTGFLTSVFQAKVDAEGGGSLKGNLTLELDALAYCSIKMKRVDTADPGVDPCTPI